MWQKVREKKSLCSFQHDDQCEFKGDSKEDLKRHIIDLHTEESVEMTEDEEHFEYDVDNCIPDVYEKLAMTQNRSTVTSAIMSQNVKY